MSWMDLISTKLYQTKSHFWKFFYSKKQVFLIFFLHQRNLENSEATQLYLPKIIQIKDFIRFGKQNLLGIVNKVYQQTVS